MLEWCFKLKIRIVTIYAFSLENFKRPRREVDALMELFRVKLGELCRERLEDSASDRCCLKRNAFLEILGI